MDLTKLEIDVSDATELQKAVQFVIKNRCNIIVVSPDLVGQAITLRGIGSGKFKIFTTIDWKSNGMSFVDTKFRGIPNSAMQADGFEVMIGKRNRQDIEQELRYLSQFFTSAFSPLVSLRLVLSCDDEQYVTDLCDTLKLSKLPQAIRISSKNQNGYKASDVLNLSKKIRQYTPSAIKVSGLMDKTTMQSINLPYFAANLKQAENLFKEDVDVEVVNNQFINVNSKAQVSTSNRVNNGISQ